MKVPFGMQTDIQFSRGSDPNIIVTIIGTWYRFPLIIGSENETIKFQPMDLVLLKSQPKGHKNTNSYPNFSLSQHTTSPSRLPPFIFFFNRSHLPSSHNTSENFHFTHDPIDPLNLVSSSHCRCPQAALALPLRLFVGLQARGGRWGVNSIHSNIKLRFFVLISRPFSSFPFFHFRFIIIIIYFFALGCGSFWGFGFLFLSLVVLHLLHHLVSGDLKFSSPSRFRLEPCSRFNVMVSCWPKLT